MPGAMSCSTEELAQRERLEAVYLRSQTPVMLDVERRVCGCAYGGNSWTTKRQAEQIAERLALRPGVRLLDLGAGTGWPALYLAEISGCEAMLVDLPFNGLKIARKRARKDALTETVRTAVADASALPFPAHSFEAISHSDLLCCLEPKRAVLESCRRVLAPDGRMLFTVISVAPGLSESDRRRAVASGPTFIDAEADYPTLLDVTGWDIVERDDITALYAESCRRQLDADESHETDLVALLGTAEYDDRVSEWRNKLVALGDGLLQRELFLVVPRAD